jgi:prolyl-tRNA synthetase
VKDLFSSYKDLPTSLYQIQWKFRDEQRPRAGLLRGREFLMKDSYSFDVDDAGLQASYDRHRDAYIRTFDRLGFDYVVVAAMSGAMGGSASEEFLAVSSVGEDTYVRCTTCDYAANVEAVRVPAPPRCRTTTCPRRTSRTRRTRRPSTPGQAVERPRGPASRRPGLDRRRHAEERRGEAASPGRSSEALAVGVPGDREVDLKRLGAQVLPALVEPVRRERTSPAAPALVRGYIGPAALGPTSPRRSATSSTRAS